MKHYEEAITLEWKFFEHDNSDGLLEALDKKEINMTAFYFLTTSTHKHNLRIHSFDVTCFLFQH